MSSIIREVWNYNVVEKFNVIRMLLPLSVYASFNMEFPGTIFYPNVPKHFLSSLSPPVNYSYLDDFNVDYDIQNLNSIALLRETGIDFVRNKFEGINSVLFKNLLISSGLLCGPSHLNWITFHGAYDFGFLVKILTQRPLPPDLIMFMNLVREIFVEASFDLKHIVKFCRGLYGGLSRLPETLNVDSHQAGSDSLLTMHVFFKVKEIYFNGYLEYHLNRFKGIIHGIKLPIEFQPRRMLMVPIWPQFPHVTGAIYNGLVFLWGGNN